MKSMISLFIFLLISSCFSFSPYHRFFTCGRSLLQQKLSSNNGVDQSSSNEKDTSPHLKAIQEALEASKTYGATSPEARVAWEIAEEIEDSIFSPCSKRCDPIAPVKQQDLPPLFIEAESSESSNKKAEREA